VGALVQLRPTAHADWGHLSPTEAEANYWRQLTVSDTSPEVST